MRLQVLRLLVETAASISAPVFIILSWNTGSWITLLGAPICLLIFKFSKRYAYNLTSMKHVSSAINAINSSSKDFCLSKIDVSDYLDNETLSYLKFQGCNIKIIHTNSISNKILSSFRAYRDLGIGETSLIFLGNSDDKFLGIRKFFLLHEIGHFTPDSYLLAGMMSGQIFQAILAIVPIFFILSNASNAVFGFVIFLFVIFCWLVSWRSTLEISADGFAAVSLLRTEGKNDALQILKGIAAQFDRIGSSLDLDKVDKSREFFHRSRNMKKLVSEIEIENNLDFFGFGNKNFFFSAPIYFSVYMIHFLLMIVVIILAFYYGDRISIHQLAIMITLLIVLTIFVLYHEWRLSLLRGVLNRKLSGIAPVS